MPQATPEQKSRLIYTALNSSIGKIMENFVIANVYKMLCNENKHNMLFDESERWYVSKISHKVKEVQEEADLIILDKKYKETFLFEIKHSKESDPEQVKHLESKDFIEYITNNFSPVKNCIVLYNGNNDISQNTPRLNISQFLIHMYNNCQKPDYSVKQTINYLCGLGRKDTEYSLKKHPDKSDDGCQGL